MSLSDLQPHERFVYEWQYNQLGSFKQQLAQTIAKADPMNRARLRLSYPEEVLGIELYHTVEGWWEDVERRASPSQL